MSVIHTGLPPRVVIVSAHGSATDRVRGTFAGCDAYLTKPIKEETMLGQLRTLGLVAPAESERPRRKRSSKTAAPAGSDFDDTRAPAAEPHATAIEPAEPTDPR